MIKNLKHVESNINSATVFLNTQSWILKDDLIEYKCLCCNKNYQHKFDEKLLYYCKKVFILMNIYGWLGNIQWNIIT